ncbi:uroporphyrinogen-III synthase [uncultured Tateyamaria sp.]|uniref:uroporphyrinogen-III synthase n=1 Tax=uncultured Tateyamaria sp. TaxID=455651 RepID=UPI002622043D|nr:uroporphyrinogen-III synthase [uncultured Tateyamaria sp.]
MTRPRAAADRFVAGMPPSLRAQVEPVFSPLLDIVPVTGWHDPDDDAIAIFTSSNGVIHGPESIGRTAYCVGEATTALAQSRGWAARMAGADAESLVSHVRDAGAGHTLVHIRGRHTRSDVAARLGASGHAVRTLVVYDQVLKTLTAQAQQLLSRNSPTIVPLFSPRTAMQFAKMARSPTSTQVIALSPAVADAAAPLEVHCVCDRPDAPAMYDAMSRTIASG